MTTEDRKPSMNDLIRAAALTNGRVKAPDTSKGETWESQMSKALEGLRNKNRRTATANDTAHKTDDKPHETGDGQFDQQLDPFTMNDLMRKAFGR
jgi:hypothetical protein